MAAKKNLPVFPSVCKMATSAFTETFSEPLRGQKTHLTPCFCSKGLFLKQKGHFLFSSTGCGGTKRTPKKAGAGDEGEVTGRGGQTTRPQGAAGAVTPAPAGESMRYAEKNSGRTPSAPVQVQAQKKRHQQQELIAELRKRQAKDHRPVYEGKDGTIEDIITGGAGSAGSPRGASGAGSARSKGQMTVVVRSSALLRCTLCYVVQTPPHLEHSTQRRSGR